MSDHFHVDLCLHFMESGPNKNMFISFDILFSQLQKEDEAVHALREQLREAIDSNEVLEFNVLELRELTEKVTCIM